MILGPVSVANCFVAGLILAPQLLGMAGVYATGQLVYAALPLICKQ